MICLVRKNHNPSFDQFIKRVYKTLDGLFHWHGNRGGQIKCQQLAEKCLVVIDVSGGVRRRHILDETHQDVGLVM